MFRSFEGVSLDQVKSRFNTNVFGIFLVIRSIIPHIKQNKEGTIINISSVAGKIEIPFSSLYSATKFAIEGFSESLQFELSPFNIKIKIVESRIIKTNILQNTDFINHLGIIEYKKQSNKIINDFNNYYKVVIDKSNKLRYPIEKDAINLLG